MGRVIKCRTIKNKTAPPRRTGQVDFYFEDANGHFAGDYDTIRESSTWPSSTTSWSARVPGTTSVTASGTART